MKKIYCCLTWAALTVALTACGNNQQTAEPAKESKATVESPAVQEAAPPAGHVEQAAPAVQEVVPPADQAPPPAADQAPPAEQPASPHN